jgi:hypothetical protein
VTLLDWVSGGFLCLAWVLAAVTVFAVWYGRRK